MGSATNSLVLELATPEEFLNVSQVPIPVPLVHAGGVWEEFPDHRLCEGSEINTLSVDNRTLVQTNSIMGSATNSLVLELATPEEWWGF
jgi:hypothetical protein